MLSVKSVVVLFTPKSLLVVAVLSFSEHTHAPIKLLRSENQAAILP